MREAEVRAVDTAGAAEAIAKRRVAAAVDTRGAAAAA